MVEASRKFFFTVDVDWIPGSEVGLYALVNLCHELHVPISAFFAGRFAAEYPELVRTITENGNDIGVHGWQHGLDPSEDFRIADYDAQRKWMELSVLAVEEAAGRMPRMFRAPNLAISETTFRILEELDFILDSSVPAGRFDFGCGAVSYGKYFSAPRGPYYPCNVNLSAEGSSPVLEIPPSAFVLPLNMSALRKFGLRVLLWLTRRVMSRSRLLVFYMHPAEFVEAEQLTLHPDEPRRYRQNIGPRNLQLLRTFVESVLSIGYEASCLSSVVKDDTCLK